MAESSSRAVRYDMDGNSRITAALCILVTSLFRSEYTGTAGDTVNCQVGVLLAYASERGAAFINRALYLPRVWTQDAERRAEAGIPVGVRFASKITLAERMLARAFDAATPARWVVADSFYGRSGAFRRWLEERGRAHAVMMWCDQGLWQRILAALTDSTYEVSL